MKNKREVRSRHLRHEVLESRQMMAVTTLFSQGILNVYGTNANESVAFKQTNGVIAISGIAGSWNAAQINAIVIDLKGGSDNVSLRSTSNRGNQALAENITIRSGTGTERITAAVGPDYLLSGSGHTFTISTAGVVTVDGKLQSVSGPTPIPTPTPAPKPTPTPTPAPAPTPTPTNWFDANIVDVALRTLGRNLYTDGRIDRNDMLQLLRNVEDGNTIDATEFADLKKIVSNTTLFGTLDYVYKLSSYIVSGNTANAKYQGQSLGNLAAGSSSAQLEKLIGKWFLGLDHSTAGGPYRQASGQLFVNGATYADINQGYLGDCYFMASLAEVALKNPSAITNMFVVNGDGTYTVRFYNNGRAEYVTVDSFLPTNNAGQLIYAGLGKMYNNASNELWTALAEKAYVQINEMGWLRTGLPGNGQNSYAAIEGGYMYAALGQITGQPMTPFTSTAGTASFNSFVAAWNQGKSICIGSKSVPTSNTIVGGHAYAVVGYNATNQTVTLFNPWGTQYGLITMTWSQIQANFSYFDRTA